MVSNILLSSDLLKIFPVWIFSEWSWKLLRADWLKIHRANAEICSLRVFAKIRKSLRKLWLSSPQNAINETPLVKAGCGLWYKGRRFVFWLLSYVWQSQDMIPAVTWQGPKGVFRSELKKRERSSLILGFLLWFKELLDFLFVGFVCQKADEWIRRLRSENKEASTKPLGGLQVH